MGYPGERRRRRTGGIPFVVGINVALLAGLLALLIVASVWLTKPAFAGHGYNFGNAAFDPYGTGHYQIRWWNRPACCGDMVDAGVGSWDAMDTDLSGVNWIHTDNNMTLRFRGCGDAPSATTLGRYDYNFFGVDEICFYTENINRMNLGAADRRWLGRHETGHALSLKHPYEISETSEAVLDSDRNQRCCVLHTYHHMQSSSNPGITTLTDHDRSHYRGAW